MNLFLRPQKMRYEMVPGGATGAMPEKRTFTLTFGLLIYVHVLLVEALVYTLQYK